MLHSSICLGSLARCNPDGLIVTCESRSLSARLFAQQVANLSSSLIHDLGLECGARIVLLGESSDDFITALLASLDAGAIVAPLNIRWGPADVSYAMHLLKPQILMVDERCMALATSALAMRQPSLDQHGAMQQPSHGAMRLPRLVQIGHGSWMDLLSTQQLIHSRCSLESDNKAASRELQMLHPPDGSALICFTSGTTGRPKGVVLSHANLHVQSLAKLARVGYCREDVYLHLAPLFHIGGLSSLMAVLMAGASQVVLPRFDAVTALELIGRHGVTAFIAVPTMIRDLLSAAASLDQAAAKRGLVPGGGGSSQQWSSVRRILVGAGGTDESMQASLRQLFPNAAVYSAYGMTEACSSITFNTLHDPGPSPSLSTCRGAQNDDCTVGPSRRCDQPLPGACAGYPAPGVEVMVLGPGINAGGTSGLSSSSAEDDGVDLPDGSGSGRRSRNGSRSSEGLTGGSVGEVLTRGPHVMMRYWRDELATKEALTPNGWLKTGDLGRIDRKGRLWLLGRVKDMVKSGGENVFAPEVEEALCRHPNVVSAAVVGLPDERLGEKVAAVVVLEKGMRWSGVELGRDIGSDVRAAKDEGSEGGQALPPDRDGVREGGSVNTGDAATGGAVLSAEVLREFCRGPAGDLAGYKLPRVVVAQAGALPMNVSGKVLKHVLRSKLEALLKMDSKM